MRQQHDIETLLNQVVDNLNNAYGVTVADAKKAIEQYELRELAEKYPNSTFHYPPNYWAEEIHRVQL